MEFTDEQKRAIEERGRQLLVSAAAGSGKTAVLVERIIRRILDDKDPVDIDRMLIMTFTKAAASQMRDKIFRAIEEKKALDPLNPNLIRQSALVHNARISTIHGFCLDVIRDHYMEIGLDPDFRVADETEARLLKQNALETVIERAYEEGSDDFVNLTESLDSGKADSTLEKILGDLYDFSVSYPDPDEWLDKSVSLYTDITDENIDSQPWMKLILENARLNIKEAMHMADLTLKLINDENGPYMYGPAVVSDIEAMESLLVDCDDYDSLYGRLSSMNWATLGRPSKDGPAVDEELKDAVKKTRESYKRMLNALGDSDFAADKEEQAARIRECAPLAKELARLVREVRAEFDLKKREKKLADFSDLEHYCIKILSAPDGNTAREYMGFFEEIYVDEYQDSNLVQEEMLKYIARDDNLFMVGDVKQSIYSFRLARPQLFMDKYYRAEAGEDNLLRIDLSHNFRSRTDVLDTVNELFAQIMHREFGGIEYDDSAKLNYGADYSDSDNKDSELIMIESDPDVNKIELEARVIAKRIHELMKEQTVSDATEDDPKRVRPLRYSDIVILLRTARGWDNVFSRVLSEEGIPVYAMSQTGYFSAYEVSILLDYLTVLDNPLQDIPMAAVLRSVLGGFDDEELACLRNDHPAKHLFGSLEKCAAAADGSSLSGKAAGFLDKYGYFRDKVGYTPVSELLLELVDGDYGTYISSMPMGRRRMANLNMLLKKAEDYGKASFKGLFHFVKYIETLKKYDVDYGEAGLLDENADAVAIMTIHKSKGLEFPVCFVAGMSKNYNLRDAYGQIIPDIDLGMGVPHVDPIRRTYGMTPVKSALAKKKEYEIRAEEERVLYVAMTRAKEKLIMTGVVNDVEKVNMNPKGLIKCSCYLDLVINALNRRGIPSLTVKTSGVQDIIDADIKDTVSLEEGRERFGQLFERSRERNDDPFAGMIRERLDFSYPYEDERNLFEKVSVTELKRRHMHENTDKELPDEERVISEADFNADIGTSGAAGAKAESEPAFIPDFIREQEKEIPATLHGTAVHRIFEIWDYTLEGSETDVRDFMEHVKEKGLMDEALVNCVSVSEVKGFVNSELAARMKKAYENGKLYREQPFMFSFEGIIIQGIIDAYFIEDNEIVIVDYKTDRVDDVSELKERYHIQLEYYAKALSVLLDMPVSQMLIYSTRHNKTLAV